MSSEDTLTNELKLQSKRDLDAARHLLSSNSIEIVAWLCEQAYEKIVMYVYVYYKIKFKNRTADWVYKKLLEKEHQQKHHLIINMVREIFKGMIKEYQKFGRQMLVSRQPPDVEKDVINLTDERILNQRLTDFDRSVDKVRNKIDNAVVSTTSLSSFMDVLKAETLEADIALIDEEQHQTEMQETIAEDYLSRISNQELRRIFEIAFNESKTHNINMHKFCMKVLILAIYVLPHSVLSRYPQSDQKFMNLRMYREKSAQLRQFFEILIQHIEHLHELSQNFISALEYYRSKE
jgi:HEPN domain-containing protein